MTYSIRIEKEAAKTLAKTTKPDRIRIIEAIDRLKEQPDLGKQLSNRWKGLRRIRVGNYRVIYGMKHKELVILVVRIGHRKDIYR